MLLMRYGTIVALILSYNLNVFIMKAQDFKNSNNGQGKPTSDRAFTNQNERLREKGISNSGGQRSNETSNKNSAHKPEHKKS
jgi:hypothetical protein